LGELDAPDTISKKYLFRIASLVNGQCSQRVPGVIQGKLNILNEANFKDFQFHLVLERPFAIGDSDFAFSPKV
jgi:hypothetical protein